MGAAIYRGKRGEVVWEDERCTLHFEYSAGQDVSASDLVNLEGSLELSALDGLVAQAAAEINAHLKAGGRV